mmetsp:Transcript_85881/g.221047  ORF Transcript_85881/g.221047 Transcript_85881/m.221047 type:complete len:211 (-) Transcript_85881:298-930(-)
MARTFAAVICSRISSRASRSPSLALRQDTARTERPSAFRRLRSSSVAEMIEILPALGTPGVWSCARRGWSSGTRRLTHRATHEELAQVTIAMLSLSARRVSRSSRSAFRHSTSFSSRSAGNLMLAGSRDDRRPWRRPRCSSSVVGHSVSSQSNTMNARGRGGGLGESGTEAWQSLPRQTNQGCPSADSIFTQPDFGAYGPSPPAPSGSTR